MRPPLFALVGNPNVGKTTLFNTIADTHAVVGNYSGVTVECTHVKCKLPSGKEIALVDLPGVYFLEGEAPDEKITQSVLLGKSRYPFLHQRPPDHLLVVCSVMDLYKGLRLALELQALKIPMSFILSQVDKTLGHGVHFTPMRHVEIAPLGGPFATTIDLDILAAQLGMPVISASPLQPEGLQSVFMALENFVVAQDPQVPFYPQLSLQEQLERVESILKASTLEDSTRAPVMVGQHATHYGVDRWLMHPVVGPFYLLGVFFIIFQVIFNWAETPMSWIEAGIGYTTDWIQLQMPNSLLGDLLASGIVAGVGSVVVFLPQILLLFSLLFILDDSGLLPRIAFLMDAFMRLGGLQGKAVIPLLTSFACAIPGVMATRTIADRKDRLVTMVMSVFIPCSAKLPVYSLFISAFIPNIAVLGMVKLRGLVLFGLYVLGLMSSLLVGFFLRKMVFRGESSLFIMELPAYQMPRFKLLGRHLWEKIRFFLSQAGTMILAASIVIWFLTSFPRLAEVGSFTDAEYMHKQLLHSYAGRAGQWLQPLFAPLGWSWKVVVALIPGFAAREVVISALSTVYHVHYNLSAEGLAAVMQADIGLAGGVSLLMFYLFACQCMSTLAVVRKEAQSWAVPLYLLGGTSLLAYASGWLAFNIMKRFF